MTITSWDDVAKAMPEGVTIGEIFPTACPVQIKGDIVGREFYFRARYNWVSLGVGGEPVAAPEWEGGFAHGGAGWLTPAETADALLRLIDQWRRR